uniref:Uncharacterized protein n=1 Tax=Acrobeloides nanus TaxID=290746 RepID=A0A914DZH8_9BILA
MDEDTGRMEDDVLLANRKPKHSQDIVAAEIS